MQNVNVTGSEKVNVMPSISVTSNYWLNLVKERSGTFFIKISVNVVG